MALLRLKALKGMYYALILGMIAGIAMPLVAAQTPNSALTSICQQVRLIIGVVAVMMFVLGGALYGIAHMLPAAGNVRGNMQGWALGMIIGSIVGLVLVIIAPFLIGLIAANSGTSNLTAGTATC